MTAKELIKRLQERVDKHPDKDYTIIFYLSCMDNYEVTTLSSFSNYPSTGGPVILLGTD